MATFDVKGVVLEYEIIGDSGPAWVLTPGGRFSKDKPGVREMATSIAERGNRVLIWDRPNCGASSVCFEGDSESEMQADHLAVLLRELDLGPAVIAGGSAGSRVSMLTAARHPDVVSGLALWWISGGVYGLLALAHYYCGSSIAAAWTHGMERVCELDIFREPIERNPANRDLILGQDRAEFVAAMERWAMAYVPRADELVPGLSTAAAAAIEVPAIVFRSGSLDANHIRAVSEETAALLPNAQAAELPWPDDGDIEREAAQHGWGAMFTHWPLLVPQLHDWATATLS